MTISEIYALIIAAAPAVASIIGIIIAVVKDIKANTKNTTEVIDKFEEVRQEIFNTKEYSELKTELKIAHQENYELKKKLNELLTKIDHIQRNEDE